MYLKGAWVQCCSPRKSLQVTLQAAYRRAYRSRTSGHESLVTHNRTFRGSATPLVPNKPCAHCSQCSVTLHEDTARIQVGGLRMLLISKPFLQFISRPFQTNQKDPTRFPPNFLQVSLQKSREILRQASVGLSKSEWRP